MLIGPLFLLVQSDVDVWCGWIHSFISDRHKQSFVSSVSALKIIDKWDDSALSKQTGDEIIRVVLINSDVRRGVNADMGARRLI